MIAISDFDGNIYVYDIRQDDIVFTANRYAEPPDNPYHDCQTVSFSDSEMTYLDGGIVYLWDYKSHTEPRSLHTSGNKMLFSPDRSLLAIALENGDIEIWDAATRKRQLSLIGHKSRISSFAFSPDSSRLVSADEADIAGRGRLFLWELDSGNRLHSLVKGTTEDEIFQLAFSDDGSALVFHGAWTVTLWDVNNWVSVIDFPEFTRPGETIFNIDSSLVIFATLGASVEIWDFTDNQVYTHQFAQEKPCEGWVTSLDISDDGRLIVAGDECGTVRLLGVVENAND
jgi:WD40 repeat protein